MPLLSTARVALALGLIALGVGSLLWQAAAGAPSQEPMRVIVPTRAPTPVPTITVHVAGAVASPGVYRFAAGQRVLDAVEAAGGATVAADLDQMNLAAFLVDGQRVTVPERSSATPAPAAATAGPLDLNAATARELEDLPGIGPVTAARIVEHRERNGPFATPEQLRDLKLVNSATWEKIKDLVTVR